MTRDSAGACHAIAGGDGGSAELPRGGHSATGSLKLLSVDGVRYDRYYNSKVA